jgi:regulator of sigma E protease
MIVTAIVFLLILSVLVLIHEAGHFFVAKKFGIKVEEFGFGLPLFPAIFSFKRGETVYSIYPALIGGFVKLYGEDDAGAGRVKLKGHGEKLKGDEARSFHNRPIGQRAAVVLAGVVMNVVLAVGLYYVFMFMSGFKTELPVYPPGLNVPKFLLVDQKVDSQIYISAIAKGSPAEKSGIKPFSEVISINGVRVKNGEYFLNTIKANEGKKVTLELKDEKTGKIYTAVAEPRVNAPKNQGALGVSFFDSDTLVLDYRNPVNMVFSGLAHTTNMLIYNFAAIGHLIGVSIKQGNVNELSQGVSGPVGIFKIVGVVVDIPNLHERVLQLLNLAGLLSISLAFFNVLPIPGLDGGRLFFILLESVGVKIKPRTEGIVNAIGMALLIGLIVLVTYKDIMQLIVK